MKVKLDKDQRKARKVTKRTKALLTASAHLLADTEEGVLQGLEFVPVQGEPTVEELRVNE